MATRGREGSATGEPATGPAVRMSLGSLIVLGIVVAGAAMRLLVADWLPLDAAEAAQSLPAWRAAAGEPGSAIAGPPLVFHLQRLTFELLDGGEPTARLASALAGIALVVAAWQLRFALGSTTALVAAAIFGLSPLWVFLGRHASPVTVVAAIITAGLAAWSRPGRASGLLVAALAALVLAAGGPGITFCIAALIALVGAAVRGRWSDVRSAVEERYPSPDDRRTAAIVFVVTLVLAATGLLARAEGMAALVQGPARWLETLRWSGSLAVDGFLLPAVAYAPAMLGFGVVGALVLAGRGTAVARFIAVWAAVGLVLGLILGTPATLAEAALPLGLAAAAGIARLAASVGRKGRWSEEGVMTCITLLVLSYAGLQLLRFAQAETGSEGMSGLSVALGALLMAVVLVGVFALLWGPDVAGRVIGLTALVALPVLAWANGSWLNYRASTTLREAMRPAYVAPGAVGLAGNVAAASWARTRDPHAWPVAADPSLRAVLEWPLRRHEVRWASVQGAIDEPLVVVPAGAGAAFGDQVYRGHASAVAGEWAPSFGGAHGFVRWWLQRRPESQASQPALTWAELFVTSE